MTYWPDLLLGVIEGVTEFLPISSTGHLLLAEQWLGARSDTYNIVIQAGAILAVTLIYWKRIVGLLTGWNDPENRDYLLKLTVAFLITAVLGLVVKRLGFELPTTVQPVAWALVLGGVWMIVAEWLAGKQEDRAVILWRVAIAVGVAQIIAGIFPGTSRSGATIFAAMLLGTSNRAAATEFAFLVGIPTMYAASGYELFKQIGSGGVNEDWTALGVAFVVSTVTAFISVKWLLGFIQSHRFTAFAIYRLVFGGVLLGLAAMGLVV
ncbi:undecaprenyl-diphosphate phosphatase [Sinisalibacter aestuarii]|uniref:Undecaprenyl-diphosphatase n=1 Tax=Sinisalibacter aestuarii TaxID=2949426 RepID=A0ABQ5LNU4_9RHOB|nr:undecaprenyl-diphosphate phosphatase [Sinisalibacter aestuarii]GKY86626.1 undecaprenyl-diphosphatase [Sinisalibacter aestuarii]